jgi:hypothetical protein
MNLNRHLNTHSSRRQLNGTVLVEAIITMAVTAMLFVMVCSFMDFTGRSFTALFNYVDLDDANRIGMDQLTRDVRQANCVSDYTTTTLTLQDSDGVSIVYTYDPTAKTLTRSKATESRLMLTGCDRLTFNLRQRNTVGGSYDVYPAATPATCKVVDVSWLCSRSILGAKINTESVQTARIVIRKQGA